MLSAAQLAAAVLTAGDLSAGDKVIVPTGAPVPLGGGQLKADKPACQPLADLMSAATAIKPKALVDRNVVKGDGANAPMRLRLATYGPGDAERALEAIRAAVGACASGFTATDAGSKTHFAVKADPTAYGGENPLGVWLTPAVDGGDPPVDIWVLRTNGVLGFFSTVKMPGDPYVAMPESVVALQVGKMAVASF